MQHCFYTITVQHCFYTITVQHCFYTIKVQHCVFTITGSTLCVYKEVLIYQYQFIVNPLFEGESERGREKSVQCNSQSQANIPHARLLH